MYHIFSNENDDKTCASLTYYFLILIFLVFTYVYIKINTLKIPQNVIQFHVKEVVVEEEKQPMDFFFIVKLRVDQ